MGIVPIGTGLYWPEEWQPGGCLIEWQRAFGWRRCLFCGQKRQPPRRIERLLGLIYSQSGLVRSCRAQCAGTIVVETSTTLACDVDSYSSTLFAVSIFNLIPWPTGLLGLSCAYTSGVWVWGYFHVFMSLYILVRSVVIYRSTPILDKYDIL